MLVACPGVHGVAACVQAITQHRLAESRIGHAVVGAELHEDPRAGGTDNPVRERDVAEPGAHDAGARETPKWWIQFRRPQVPEQLDVSWRRDPRALAAVDWIDDNLCRHRILACGRTVFHTSPGDVGLLDTTLEKR